MKRKIKGCSIDVFQKVRKRLVEYEVIGLLKHLQLHILNDFLKSIQ